MRGFDGNGHGGDGGGSGASASPFAPPHSLEAEQSVLGAILMSERSMYALVIEEGLRPGDFYRRRHELVYEAMLTLYNDSEPIDVITVTEHLRSKGLLDEAGGQTAIDDLAGGVPAAGNARHYARIVREHALMRRLLTTTYSIQASVRDSEGTPRELVEQAERQMLEVAHDDRQKDFRKIEEILHDELDKLQRLSTESTSLTGTPSGYKDLDEMTGGFQPGNLIILAARPSMGKCLRSSTIVYDGQSGRRRPIADVVDAFERGEETWVASMGADLCLRPAKVSAVFRNGARPLLRVTTKLGRKVEATANHPLLTLDGWTPVEDLAPGARIAVPRHLPRRDRPRSLADAEVVLLAALVADGALTQTTPRFTASQESILVPLVEDAARAIGAKVTRYRKGRNLDLRLCRPDRGEPNPVTDLCRRHGIMGLGSSDKHVPEAIFEADDDQIRLFLSILFACDGRIHVSDRIQQVGYTSISERLVRDVQHLLLRLGLVGKIRTLKRAVYQGTETVAREVRITHQESVGGFCELIRVPGKEHRQDAALERLGRRRSKTNADTVPAGTRAHVAAAMGERTWRDVSAEAGYPASHNRHAGSRGVSRPRLRQLAAVVDDEGLDRVATSDLWWDEVVSIEPVGVDETYDLTVPLHHNFVADDIVVHNSALVCNIAENASIDHNAPVALFSLEMSETELAQRFVASQARIKGDDLRKGRVAEHKWPKIMEASQRLARAPMFIDDSSDVGLLEIRAKARRLHQQHGLGLIIIDYLQLLRADARIENRVEAIGQMSRGLKILARELQCPVIALSQLNRSVESRTDKRPVLSDLRESGCLTGDTLVELTTGERVEIKELRDRRDVRVHALNTETWRLEERVVTNAFSTGVKPVNRLTTRLGRSVRATANHKFLTLRGWRRLDQLAQGDRIALPRQVPSPQRATMTDDELALLGHLIGDGCTLPRQPLYYTTVDPDVAQHVARLATRVFGEAVRPRVRHERTWLRVYLPATRRLTHGVRNPVAAWLDGLGVFGLRSHEERVPDAVFGQPHGSVATFLRHLWETDGCLWHREETGATRVYYATSSERLARDVQSLLLRLDIRARLKHVDQRGRGRDQWHVDVSGAEDVEQFLLLVGGFGEQRGAAAQAIESSMIGRRANTNRDVVPREAWDAIVRPAMARGGVTTRALQAGIGMSYAGSTLYRSAMSRERAGRVAEAVDDQQLSRLAMSDVYWDEVVSIEPDGIEEVFDLTVDGLHNFIAGDVIVHNSIEQDADLVAFIYRDEYYDKESEREGEADIIIAKHRNGAIGEVTLTFQKEYPKFLNYAGERFQ
jgi:replicative DNA helicase